MALAIPVGAFAGPGGGKNASANAYVPADLLSNAQANPAQLFNVIVEGSKTGKSNALADKVARSAVDTSTPDAPAPLVPGQIKNRFDSIDGLSGMLSGKQILKIAKSKDVTAILPNAAVKLSGNTLPDFNFQKWAWAAGAPVSWHADHATPAIAIVDSGVDSTRSDFNGRVVAQQTITNLPGNSAGDGYGHGTFVASIAAGSATGHAGVAPNAPIVSLDVMDDNGMSTVGDVINACDWIMRNKSQYNIRIANFSLHATNQASILFDPLDQAVEKLWLNGVVVVAAAGNYGTSAGPSGVPFAPGNDPFVITVGATDINNSVTDGDDFTAPWSAYGYTPDGFAKPDLAAPGRFMIGAVPASATLAIQRPASIVAPGYMQLSGTSFSAPVVSGAAAALLAMHPTWTPDQVKGALMVTAKPAPKAAPMSIGVGEVWLPKAFTANNAPNPNAALDKYVTVDSTGTSVFDASAWQQAALASAAWSTAAWSDAAWSTAAWSTAAWSTAAWSTAAWSTAAWGTAAWGDAAWADAAWADAAWADNATGDPTVDAPTVEATPDEILAASTDAGLTVDSTDAASMADPTLFATDPIVTTTLTP